MWHLCRGSMAAHPLVVSVPDSAFAVPSGYTESKGYGGMGGMGPSQQQRDQMLQRLTPEQRKQVEEMMKQHGAGAK